MRAVPVGGFGMMCDSPHDWVFVKNGLASEQIWTAPWRRSCVVSGAEAEGCFALVEVTKKKLFGIRGRGGERSDGGQKGKIFVILSYSLLTQPHPLDKKFN